MSDSSIVIIQGTVGLYTVATRCHTCFAVTLKYTEDSSLTILWHSSFRLRSKRKVLNQYLDLDSRSRFLKFLEAIILLPFYITSTGRSIIYEVLFTRNSCHYGTCLLLPNSKEIKIMKSPLQEEVRVLLSACSLIGQIIGTFFSLLLKINKVVEMTIDSQINLLIHGIDCFFG